MSVNLGLLIVAGVLGATGAYLLTERSMIRMLLGLMLVGNGINLMIVTLAGPPGHPPIKGRESAGAEEMADPLAQAMILTAIVITMGIAAFVLALTYRLFVINREDDEIEDDTEDVKILTGSLKDFPDRDRSDDPETGADTVAGDLFDSHGNPMTPEEFAAAHQTIIETDLMPEDAAVVAGLPEDGEEMPPEDDDDPNGTETDDDIGDLSGADDEDDDIDELVDELADLEDTAPPDDSDAEPSAEEAAGPETPAGPDTPDTDGLPGPDPKEAP